MTFSSTMRKAALALLMAAMGGAAHAQSAAPKPQAPAKPQAAPKPQPLPDARWMLDYPEQEDSSNSDDSNVERDPKYLPFLKAYLAEESFFDRGKRPIWQAAQEFLNVSTGKVKIYDQKYATLGGCVAHMCDQLQGFLWVDTAAKTPRVYFAAWEGIDDEGSGTCKDCFALWIFSNQVLGDDENANLEPLPAEFLGPLADWLGQLNVTWVTFTEPSGAMVPLAPGALKPKAASQGASSTTAPQ